MQSSAVTHVHDEVALNRVAHADSSLVCDPPHPRVRRAVPSRAAAGRRAGPCQVGLGRETLPCQGDGPPQDEQVDQMLPSREAIHLGKIVPAVFPAAVNCQAATHILSLSPTQSLPSSNDRVCPLYQNLPLPSSRTLPCSDQQHLSPSPASQVRTWLFLLARRQLMPISSFTDLSLPLSTARRSLFRVSFVGYETDPQQWTSVSRMERVGGSESRASS